MEATEVALESLSTSSRSPSMDEPDHLSSEDQPLLPDEERTCDSLSTYDTYESSGGEEEVVASGSSWAAYINITCVVAGTGVLGLPYSIKQGGWIGLIFLFPCACPWIVLLILFTFRKTRLSSYADIGFHAFGNFGKYFLVGIFNNAILLGVPVLFFILAGQSLDNIVEQIWDIKLGVRVWTQISAVFVALPFIFTKTLKEVVVLSVFGAVTTFFTVIAIVILSFADLSNVISTPNPPSHNILVISELPVALASISFSFGGNSVFPHIEENMKNKQNWNTVVGLALATCAIMYALVAFAGYYVYGDNTMSPIFLNLPKASLFMTMHVLMTAPILLTSFAYDAEKHMKITSEYLSPWAEFALRTLFRTCLIIACTSIAVFVPFFGDFMALLGALSVCAIVFILPVVFYLKLFGFNISILELLWNLFVMIVGIIGCVIGTADAVSALLKDFREMDDNN
ncbi:7385_t:CDS:2 [Cetraspora pellucida]|uniref:7385_t:CDS:1 n=1 Tax=Cetraspora pellucida TaxID=1433469 RepID=A0A9N9NS93_9GLOM|nr:7385_t:CDS:2 [Cetraspora pellucida]